jgi:hypothetical protein
LGEHIPEVNLSDGCHIVKGVLHTFNLVRLKVDEHHVLGKVVGDDLEVSAVAVDLALSARALPRAGNYKVTSSVKVDDCEEEIVLAFHVLCRAFVVRFSIH